MSNSTSSAMTPEERLDAALGDYMRRIDQDDAIDRDEFLAEYPDLAAELRAHFETCDFVEQMAGPMLSDVSEQRQTSASDTASISLANHDTLPPGVDSASGAKSGTSRKPISGMFGRYRIVKTLGEGGMGAVYLAKDPNLDRSVAVKVPFFDEADQQSVLDRFQREAKSAAAIQHPNICPIHDVGIIDGMPFIAMAYIEGKPLSELIQPDKPLPIRPVLMLVRRLALALEEAHSKGVIHRDLKPANIMVNKRREPIIMDFGLARREGKGDVQLTKSGQMMGTPLYMPPEQVSGSLETMGPGCDIYSLGVILYQMLTGRVPFTGDLLAVISQIALDDPKPPSNHRPELDHQLNQICLKAMAKKVADRFSSMGEFAKHLTRYLKSQMAQSGVAESSSTKGKNEIDELFGEAVAFERAARAMDKPIPRPQPPREEVQQATPEPPSIHQSALHPAPPMPTLPSLPPAPTVRTLQGTRPQKGIPTSTWVALGGSLAAMLIVLWGVTIFLRSGDYTVKIEIDDPKATVFINGNEVTVSGVGRTINLKPGKHRYEIRRGSEVIKGPEEFTVMKDNNQVLRISVLEEAIVRSVADDDDQPIVAIKPPQVVVANDTWTDLFDGKSLDGWTIYGTDDWSVKDGEIVCIGRNSKLVHDIGPLIDFDIRLECLLEGVTNSGLFLRTGKNADHQDGYEVNLLQLATSKEYRTGSIYDRAPFSETIVERSKWFPVEARVRGNVITVNVNGRETVRYTDPDRAFPSGHIALQGYSSRGQVRFRKIAMLEVANKTSDPDHLTVETPAQPVAKNTPLQEVNAIKRKLTEYVNSGQAGNPPDKKKIDAFVKSEADKAKDAGRLPRKINLRMNVKVNQQGKVLNIGVAGGFGGGRGVGGGSSK